MNRSKKNYYRVRAFPNHVDRFSDFMKGSFVAIGWPAIKDVTAYSKQDISGKLAKYYPDLTGRALGLTTGFFTRLLSMKPGDIILIPYNNEIVIIAEVTETYKYVPKLADSHMAHTVNIKQLKKLPVTDLPSNLKRSIDTIATVISLNKYVTEIDQLISNEHMIIQQNEGLSFISNNTEKSISLHISANVNKEDLKKFLSRLDF